MATGLGIPAAHAETEASDSSEAKPANEPAGATEADAGAGLRDAVYGGHRRDRRAVRTDAAQRRGVMRLGAAGVNASTAGSTETATLRERSSRREPAAEAAKASRTQAITPTQRQATRSPVVRVMRTAAPSQRARSAEVREPSSATAVPAVSAVSNRVVPTRATPTAARVSRTSQASTVAPATEVVDVVSRVVARVAAPFVAPEPTTPARPPLLLAVLGWVRREAERTFRNQTPVAADDVADTSEDTAVPIDVLANDTDPDTGDVLTVTSVGQPANGTAVLNPDGTVTYTPNTDFNGEDTFTYTASDETSRPHVHGLLGLFTGGGHTTTGTVVVTVAAVNDAPMAGPDSYDATEDDVLDSAMSALPGLLVNDADVDADTSLSVVAETKSTEQGGSVVLNADGSFVYTPAANFHGDDTFGYTLTDSSAAANATGTGSVTIHVAPVNDAPTVVASGADPADGSIVYTVADVDGDVVAVTVLSGPDPAHGTLVDNGDGTLTYTPDRGFAHGLGAQASSIEAFTLQLDDGSEIVEVTEHPVVTFLNAPPSDITFASTGDAVTIQVHDPDNDQVYWYSYSLSDTSKGTLAVQTVGKDVVFVFTPTADALAAAAAADAAESDQSVTIKIIVFDRNPTETYYVVVPIQPADVDETGTQVVSLDELSPALQQQLGLQALAVANSSAQNILALFR
ncbi:tandem-95 repeat protein [Mycolicibacterium moriokaense]|nr:tandem-95 repeat protein [Mycolicibacterium moriokaense]